MNRTWYQDNPKHREEIKEYLYQHKELLDKLSKICYTKVKELEKKRRASSTYSDPNWAYEQADMNGYLRCLYELEQLFKLENE